MEHIFLDFFFGNRVKLILERWFIAAYCLLVDVNDKKTRASNDLECRTSLVY